jgi:hypothetical protein
MPHQYPIREIARQSGLSVTTVDPLLTSTPVRGPTPQRTSRKDMRAVLALAA